MRRAVLLCEKASVRRIFLLQYPAHFLRAFRAVPGDPELYHRLQPLAEKGLMVIKLLLRRKIKFPDQPLQVILHYGWQRLKGQALPAVAFQIAAEKILILTDKLKQLQKTARQPDLLIYDKKIQKLCIHFSHNTAHQSINIFKMAVKGGPVYPGQTADLAHRNLTDILLLQQLQKYCFYLFLRLEITLVSSGIQYGSPLFPRATNQAAMLAWIFGDCRKGCYMPVAHVLHRPKRSVNQIPRCLQRGI